MNAAETAPGRVAHDRRRLTAHDARAWLVDYLAACLRDAEAPEDATSAADPATLRTVVEDLSHMLRRWDVTADCDHSPH
ncbi:hypothetical protein ACWEOE_31845 [Amycolatopsis sp. NPDC004368]